MADGLVMDKQKKKKVRREEKKEGSYQSGR